MKIICFLVVIVVVACGNSTAKAAKEAEEGLKAPLAKNSSAPAPAVKPAPEIKKAARNVVHAGAPVNETAAPKPPPRRASAPLPAAARNLKLAKPQRSRREEISTTALPLPLPLPLNSTEKSLDATTIEPKLLSETTLPTTELPLPNLSSTSPGPLENVSTSTSVSLSSMDASVSSNSGSSNSSSRPLGLLRRPSAYGNYGYGAKDSLKKESLSLAAANTTASALPLASNSTASSIISSSGRARHIRSLFKKLFFKHKKFLG